VISRRALLNRIVPPERRMVNSRCDAIGSGSRRTVPIVSSALPRKEVIQPQVPLRLPCYDFAPVTKLTFGRFLPKGLDHGLRVLPASMA
jgi:hypothetical protein